jgi:hypothetical protein
MSWAFASQRTNERSRPSAAFSRIDENGVGPVEVVAFGAGPADGFAHSEHRAPQPTLALRCIGQVDIQAEVSSDGNPPDSSWVSAPASAGLKTHTRRSSDFTRMT